MQGPQIDTHGRILFYGNAVGFVRGGKAYADPLFEREELTDYFARQGMPVQWQDGLYERLAAGQAISADSAPPKSCRIWQLRPEVAFGKKFIGYTELVNRFGEPDRKDYAAVYDGTPDTNDLEALYAMFCENLPADYSGHALAVSDIVELYDEGGSDFYYCDTKGFVPLFKQN